MTSPITSPITSPMASLVPEADVSRPAALLLASAAEVPPNPDPRAWRDEAMVHAAGEAWAAGDYRSVGALAAGYDALLLQIPKLTDDGRLVLQPVSNAERRLRGAFSTPPAFADSLARRALADWPSSNWPSSDGQAGTKGLGGDGRVPAVVDPACGAGALLRAVLARLLRAGLAPERAVLALHGVDADPVAVQLCRAALAADLALAGYRCEPEWLAARIVTGDALLGATPLRPAVGSGLVWHEVFGQVLDQADAAVEPVTGWRGGFDAVVANPPWERLKVLAKDWDGAPPQGLRDDRAVTAKALRDAGRHPLTGVGELNAYLPFVETCWRLLAPAGRAAILVPAGISSDRSAARLIEALTWAGALDRLHLIEPAVPIFTGVSSRIAVAIVELSGGPHPVSQEAAAERSDDTDTDTDTDTEVAADAPERSVEVAVGLSGPDDPPGERAWRLTGALLRVLNPNTGTAPLFASATDAQTVIAVHRRVPVLLRRDPQTREVIADAWRLSLITPLHMTRDAQYFRPAPGPGLLPLWEAKHCALLDPYGGNTREQRYWVPEELVRQRYGGLCDRGWLAGYRNVSTTVAPRTLLPSPLPVVAVGNSLPLISAPRLPLLLAALATLPVDYLLRQKHAGANVNFFKLEQVPVPGPDVYDRPSPWGDGTIGDWVLARFARAVVWAPGLRGLAAELRRDGVPLPVGLAEGAGTIGHARGGEAVEAVGAVEVGGAIEVGGAVEVGEAGAQRVRDRKLARADLDAALALLLGLTRAELEHLLSTFTLLRSREQELHGRFVTANRVLAAYDRLS